MRQYLSIYFAARTPEESGFIQNNNQNSIFMENTNRIELRGNIGNVRVQDVGERKVARFSLATNYIYKGKEGAPVIETTWHNITLWSNKQDSCFNLITKGAFLYVIGRLRSREYTGNDGSVHQIMEVIAYKIEAVKTSEQENENKTE